MDWLFLGLIILGSVWGWTKESKEVFGQHIIQEVTKEKEKSIQEVNHASTELADIMASMKGEMK